MTVSSKIRLLTTLLVFGASLVVALVVYLGYRDSSEVLQEEVLEQRVASDISRLESAFGEVAHDIRLLEGLPDVLELATGAGSDQRKSDLAQILSQLLRVKPHYVQARFIGVEDGGREVVRVDRLDGEVILRGEAELQRKGKRSYFLDTMKKDPGEIYYSSIDLNREHGIIEVPHRPMLRLAMTVPNGRGGIGGMVVLNMDFQGFLNEFMDRGNPRFDHYLCTANGDYLLHPLKERTYGFDLGQRYTVQEEFPGMLGFLESDDEGRTVRFDSDSDREGTLFHLRKAYPLEDGRLLAFGVVARFDDVISASRLVVYQTVAIVVVFLCVAFVGALVVSSFITKPIDRITAAARSFGLGSEEDVPLPVERDDEIGTLAKSFSAMRGSLREQGERIQRTNDSLVRANRDLEHFAHISSHELREPLTRMGGIASLLQMELGRANVGEALKLVEGLKREALGALQQITDFRVFAKLGDGNSVRSEVDLEVLLKMVLEEFALKIEQRGVAVSMDPMPRVEAYGNLVKVLYRNLLENALKYAEGEGVRIRFSCERVEKALVLGVYNSGSTIAEEERGNVFQLFERLNRETEGTGIGLAICERIVERHSGKIWVESGEGFVHFKFTLRE